MPRTLLLWLLVVAFILSAGNAQASHTLGGELTYEYIGTPTNPDRYRVTCRFFRDCSGVAASPTVTLYARAEGCTGTNPLNRSVTFPRNAPLMPGSPYCASVPGGPSQCLPTGLPNYEMAQYSGTIDLPPAAEWVLSVTENARPTMANVPGNTNLRLEATLNNLVTLTGGIPGTRIITNNSPQYRAQDVPAPFVCVNQRTTLTFSTLDPDGDSLVYSMEAPLNDCGVPSTYNSINVPGGVIMDPSNSPTNPCVVTLPSPMPSTYSAAYPILSFNTAGNCPVKTGTPFFHFDPSLSSFTFRPAQYFNTPSAQGDNKYAVVGKVTEFRRINGRYYKIGSVRRDMMLTVIDCGTNRVPNSPVAQPVVVGVGAVRDSLEILAPVMTYSEYTVRFTDPDPNTQLTVTYTPPVCTGSYSGFCDLYDGNASSILTINNNGTATPTALVRLNPHMWYVGQVFRLALRVEDDNCPIKAAQNCVLTIRIVPRTVTNSRDKAKAAPLQAHPNPFAREVTFTLSQPATRTAQVVEVYNQLGQVVDRLTVAPTATPQLTVNWQPAAGLPVGVYTARLLGSGQAVRVLRVQP